MGHTYPDRASFRQALLETLGAEALARHGQHIMDQADQGRRRFDEKFTWLRRFQTDIERYAEFVDLIEMIETQLKHQGLHHQSAAEFEQSLQGRCWSAPAQQLKGEILAYVTKEGQQIPQPHKALATSDVLESLFGKYKARSATSPLREVGKTLLLLPLYTVQLTGQFIKNAMEAVSVIDVKRWAKEVLGPSSLAKRRAALKPPSKDTETA